MLGRDRSRALLLASAGTALAFAAPEHRVDLLAWGLLAAFGALLWQPSIGPAVIAASLPYFFFSRGIVRVSFSPPGLLLLLAWAAVLAHLAWSRIRGKATALALPTTGYDGPLALFLLGAVVSLAITEYLRLSVRELRAEILEPVLFFWLLAVLRRTGAVRSAVLAFVASAVIVAVAAAIQVTFGFGGTVAEGVRRAQAWYPSANHLALVLGRALPFALALLVAGWRRQTDLGFIIPGLALLAIGLGELLTFSLGGALGSLAAVAAMLVAWRKRQFALVLLGVAAIGLVASAGLAGVGVLPERLSPLRPTSGLRIELWQSSLEMLRDHPLLGVGLDNFVYLYQQVYLREGGAAEPNLSHPHNWILHVWLQLGIVGLIGFLLLLWRFWQHLAREMRSPAPPWLAVGATGAIADTLVHGFIDNSYFLVDLAFLFWLTLACLISDPRGVSRRSVAPLERDAEASAENSTARIAAS